MLASGDHEAKSRAPAAELQAVAQRHDPVTRTVDDHPFGIRARPDAKVPPGRRQQDQRPLFPDRKGNRPASRHPNDHVGPQSIMGTLSLPDGRPKPPVRQLRAFDLKPKPTHKRRLAAGPRHPAGKDKRPRDAGAIRHFLGVRWPHGGSLHSSVSSLAFPPGSCPSFGPISSSRRNRTYLSPPSSPARESRNFIGDPHARRDREPLCGTRPSRTDPPDIWTCSVPRVNLVFRSFSSICGS